MSSVHIKGEKRTERGRSRIRKARARGRIPAVLYGGEGANDPLFLSKKDVDDIVEKRLRVVVLDTEEGPVEAMLKEIQYDVFGENVFHLDFMRLTKGEEIEIHVPLILKGAEDRKRESGMLEQHLHQLSVATIPSRIPERFEIDVSGLEFGASVTAGDIPMPEGVRLAVPPDANVVSVVGVEEEEEEAAPGEEVKEPELVGKEEKEEEETA